MRCNIKFTRSVYFRVLLMITLIITQLFPLNSGRNIASAASTYVRIKNVWQNTYLYENGDQVQYGNVDSSNLSSQWELLDAGDGSVRICNRASGEYMNIENLYSYVQCTQIESSWYSSRWFIEDAGNNQKRIRNSWQSSEYIHIENLTGVAQRGTIYSAWDSAKWIFETVTDSNPTPTPTLTPTPVPTATPTPIPTATPTPTLIPGGSNLAVGKPVTASSSVFTFVAANAVDNNTTTYWEGAGNSYPNTLTVNLGANADINSVVVKLNPDSAWSTRTQNIEVLGHGQETTAFTSLVGAANYTFNPSADNMVTIPVSARVSEIMLKFTSNTGAPAGQVAEFQIIGTPAPNPDLIITGLSASLISPVETDSIIMTAMVENIGTAQAAASSLGFYLNSKRVGVGDIPEIGPGESAQVSVNIGNLNAGSYVMSANANESNTLVELNYLNNSYTSRSSLTINEVPSSDLTGSVSWSPNNPSAGNAMFFSVNLKNQGNIATSSGAHAVSATIYNSAGSAVQTMNGAFTGTLNPGASVNIALGSWTAADGSYSLVCVVDSDNTEIAMKRANNISTVSLYSGRGANMPFITLEAEAPSNTTNGTILAKNNTLGDYAGEASGRSAVYLDSTGEYLEFTLIQPANALVLRNAVAENMNGTISLYINGVDKGNFNVTSKFSYLYASPTTLSRLGYDNSGSKAYWLYEDAQLMLDQVYPAGTVIRIQKDASDVNWIYLDMLEIEHVSAPASNPDPDKYVEVSATKSIDTALSEFRQDNSKVGIFIPAGTWEITNKIFLYGRAVEIIGAGPWYTKLVAPQSSSNSDVGFNISSSANGSTIKDLSAWGNYINRVDGPGKFINGDGMQNVTVENVWAEHFVCLYWGVNSSYNTFRDCRIKNMYADGINMTNGSSYNLITNCYARGTGDDSFALFSAIDSGSSSFNTGNVYSYLTAVCPRRAASFAVYGGTNNIFQNLYGADTLTYPGLTINSYSFGYNTLGFGSGDTIFDGVTLDRCGGDFWTSFDADDKINDYQNFGAIWVYTGDRTMQNILIQNVDINDPVYFGILIQTMYPNALPMQNIRFINVKVNHPPRYGIKFCIKSEAGQGPCTGSASFTNVTIENPGISATYGITGCPNFTVIKLGNDNNW